MPAFDIETFRTSGIDKIRRSGDVVMENGQKTDVVIAVIGPTGSGKSTFIRNVLKDLSYLGEMPDVADGFESGTQTVAAYVVPLPSKFITPSAKRLVLVDTPGFDDYELSDSEVLRRITVWLASSYTSNMKVSGMIYLFPIYPNRITRKDKANIKIFQEICGNAAFGKVRLVTTKWALCPPNDGGGYNDTGDKREKQLMETFWNEMLAEGSKIARLEENQKSAGALLHDVLEVSQRLDEQGKMSLALQREIVEQRKRLARTEAGKAVAQKLGELLQEQQAVSGDYETRQGKLQNIATQLGELKVPFGGRVKAFFGAMIAL